MNKILLLILMAVGVGLFVQGYYYEHKISTIIDNCKTKESLMIACDSLSCKFYFVAGEIEATKDPVKIDSLRDVLAERFEKLSPVANKLSVWGAK